MVKLRTGNSDRDVLHVTLLCCLYKGGDGSSELGLMMGLLFVTGPLEIVGGASHCRSLQVTAPETVGIVIANLYRLQYLQRQLLQPLPTSAGHRTSRDIWHSYCQPLQVTVLPDRVGTIIANLCRSQNLQTQVEQPLTTS
jgi:hypothetical protein